MLMPQLPGMPSNPGQGESLADSSPRGNKVKLGDAIRDVAGHRLIYPDYILPPRRYFAGPREQWTEMMLCIGKGRFQIDEGGVKIGDTTFLALGAEASFQIFEPGQNVSGHPASIWWHSAPEVGASSTGNAGLELTETTTLTPNPSATTFTFSGNNIIIPSGAGSFPSDWVAGTILRVEAQYPYTVVDGGGSARDTISGDIAQLGLSVGTEIQVVGVNSGLYVVNTVNATNLTLNYDSGAPVNALQVGAGDAAIGLRGLRFRITAYSAQQITVERLTSAGATDPTWPGFSPLNSSTSRITVDTSNSEGGWRGPFPACPAGEKTSVVEWDIFCPNGLIFIDRKGNQIPLSGYYTVQYRDMDIGGAWTSLDYEHSGATLDQIGFTTQLNLPYPMRPEVRMRQRYPIGKNELEFRDTLQWYGLRSRLNAPSSYANVTTIGIRYRSSDRISAQTESRVSVEATRILPVRSGGIWLPEQATRDIAPYVIYQAKERGYADSDIDLEELDRLDSIWKSRGDKFDMIYDSTSITVKQILQDALAAGFSELTIKRGVISAARDEPRTLYGHMYTPQNMSQALKISKSAPSEDDYDGVDVEFVNSNGWIEDTIQCRLPEDAGRKVEKIKATGITDRNRAYRYGMRRRMVQKYRRTNYAFATELDALNSEYWDYVALADDVPGFSQSALLLGAINTGSTWLLKSSEPFDWSCPGQYLVALRRPDGTLSGPYSASRFDDYHLTIPTLDFTPDTSWEIEPPHLLFGKSTRFAYPALISSIDPDGFSGASVQAVNYDERVYTYDNASAPN
nr:host specificity factor TipJ family phage tail protein [Pseudomonas aeruginosa]